MSSTISTYFCVLTIRKQLSERRFERSGRGQEPSRGHKFSILENFLFIRDFTSQTLASFSSDLVGVALVGATPLHLLSQTALPLKSPTGAFIASLRFANAVLPQTLPGTCTTNWNLSGQGPSICSRRPRCRLKAPLGLSLLRCASQTRSHPKPCRERVRQTGIFKLVFANNL